MKTIFTILLSLLICPFLKAQDIDITKCAEIGREYKSAPYLNVAKQLQQVGEKRAITQLKAWSADRKHEDQVIILCRMLFKARKNVEFRRPMIGGAHFLGSTTYKDWQLEPIAIHKGVPVLVTFGYSLAGKAEPSSMYLDFCIKNCDWNDFEYKSLKPKLIALALKDFLTQTKWNTKLSAHDTLFFKQQAEQVAASDR